MKNINRYIVVGLILTISLTQFLALDITDTHTYIDGSYVCRDFSRDLILSASKHHIYLDYIYIPEKNHMVVGLYNPLSDTITLIEPQNDSIVGKISENDDHYIRIPVWYKNMYYLNAAYF